jgi:hypothetical protein
MCGDLICAGFAGENCANCPTDCGCGSDTCYGGVCCHVPKCGIDWACGSGTVCGIDVLCPLCPGGASCFDHSCSCGPPPPPPPAPESGAGGASHAPVTSSTTFGGDIPNPVGTGGSICQ